MKKKHVFDQNWREKCNFGKLLASEIEKKPPQS